jgi:glycosyltransferase involved in cell wall biosynthesis
MLQFHILSFEGPDLYSRAGGIATRIVGLAESLAELGFETHLWFVGDPWLPGHEERGALRLHRWCDWISRYHPLGVYEGEEGKERDYASSLPPYLMREVLGPWLRSGGEAVVLAEEWHTANAAIHLDHLLRAEGLRERVPMLWTANNVFGFERIDWRRLSRAAQIATVSHYMKRCMQPLGVEALVLPNGLSGDAYVPAEREALAELARRTAGRTLLAKMARWDPDKSWLSAVEIAAQLRQRGARPLFVARGGAEAHGAEVIEHARQLGLRLARRTQGTAGAAGLLGALGDHETADVVLLESHVDADARRLLLSGADVVLANSRHEPFGLVGLETMAVGGIACTGTTGEDYARAGENALRVRSEDPREFIEQFDRLGATPGLRQAMRRAARRTADQYSWKRVIQAQLLPEVARLAAPIEAAA